MQKEEGEGSPHNEKPVKVNYEASNYDKDLVAMIERDMVQRNPNVRWYVRGGADVGVIIVKGHRNIFITICESFGYKPESCDLASSQDCSSIQ